MGGPFDVRFNLPKWCWFGDAVSRRLCVVQFWRWDDPLRAAVAVADAKWPANAATFSRNAVLWSNSAVRTPAVAIYWDQNWVRSAGRARRNSRDALARDTVTFPCVCRRWCEFARRANMDSIREQLILPAFLADDLGARKRKTIWGIEHRASALNLGLHLQSTSFISAWNSTLTSLSRASDRMYTVCTSKRSIDSRSERTERSAISVDSFAPIDGIWMTASGRALSFGSVCTVKR